MADEDVQKDKLSQAQQSGLLDLKRLEILLPSAKNDRLVVLNHLDTFIGSLVNTFKKGSKKAHNPSPSILKIIAGREVIAHQDIEFSINGFKQEDASIPGQGSPYIASTLYPEDVISIIDYLRQWLAKYYSEETKEYSWAIKISILQQKWKSAVERRSENTITKPIAEFAQGNLQSAVEELYIKIDEILKSKTQDVEYDSIDDLINEIKEKFAKEPEETWKRIGLVLTNALTEAKINTPVILIPNKNFKVSDVRLSINAIYDQIANQLDKTGGPEKPWDRVSDSTKTKFSPHQTYFSTNEIKEENVTPKDKGEANSFIKLIDQLLEELKKEPEEAGATTEKTKDDQEEGGGEEEVVDDKQINFFTKEKIIEKAIDALSMRSGKMFLSHFKNIIKQEKLIREQKDWLLTRLTTHIQDLLDQKSVQQKLKKEIDDWITAKLEPENKESNRYKISVDQRIELNEFLAKQFFTQYSNQFLELIEAVRSADGLDIDAVKVDVPEKKAIVPPVTAETAEPTQVSGKIVDRNKFIRDTTTAFLGLYFDTEGEAFREIISRYIAQETPASLTTTELIKIRLSLFNKLQLDRTIYNHIENYYQQRLGQLKLDDDVTFLNIRNTLDSILVLSEDPKGYLAQLSDKQLIEYFALEGKQINITQLRSTLLGLIFVRRTHYLISGTTVKPWLGEKKKEEVSQRLSQLRSYVGATGGDGVLALNLDKDGIDKTTIDQKRKEWIKQLYQELWRNTVSGKSPDEIKKIYAFYEVDVIKIDYNFPVPDSFIYSEAAQYANLDSPTPDQNKKANFAKKLFSKGKGKLGKLALSAVAPELAPILSSLEKLPFVGDAVKKAEEKIGDLILKIGGALLAGLIIFIQFIAKSLIALIGGIAGGIIGFALGGPLGAVGGAAAGTGIGLLIDKAGGAGVGASFSSGAAKAGIGAKAIPGVGAGVGSIPAIPNILVPATIGGTMAGSALMIATTGASMLHPIKNASDIIPDAELNISKYVELNKTADITKIENNQNTTITYTIVVTPKDEYIIKINTNETKDEWSYLGGDTINLPNQTQKILNQIGEEPLSNPVTITYSVDMSGVDVAVSNNFILSFESIDEVGAVIDMDSISAFETVIIGDPEIGCLVAGAAGEIWGGVPTLSWSGSNWNRVLTILSKRAGTSTQFMSLVCAGNTPLQTFLLKGGFDEGYGGWAPSSFVGTKVGLYEYGLSFKESSLEYTLVHELGHIIDYRNPGLRQQYLQVPGGDSKCYTYPFPSMCSGAEAFAESIALYVVHKTYYFSYTGQGYFDFPGKYPNQYEWLKDNVFGGVEFK